MNEIAQATLLIKAFKNVKIFLSQNSQKPILYFFQQVE